MAAAEVGARPGGNRSRHVTRRSTRSGAASRSPAACQRGLQRFRAIANPDILERLLDLNLERDIGRAQPAILRLAEGDLVAGDVIDVGCGRGEDALYLASRGLAVIGVDAAPTAIAQTQEKAQLRGSSATFLVADALALEGLERTFIVAIDCGLFHTFSDPDRVRFERSLHGTPHPVSLGANAISIGLRAAGRAKMCQCAPS
jgi:2-polyprenyl-3-methyl-5-hydroxy-6-metoxy-1,4-benzoquinol methylase